MARGRASSESSLDAVEIKLSVGRSIMRRTAEAFGLDRREGEARRVYFCDSAGRAGLLPLLDQGIILRLRARADAEGDST